MHFRLPFRVLLACLMVALCVPAAWAQRMTVGPAAGGSFGFGSYSSGYSLPGYASPYYGGYAGYGGFPYAIGGVGGLAASPEPYAAPVIPSYPVVIADATYDWSTWDPPAAVLLLKDGEVHILGVRRELPLPRGLIAEAREPEPLGDIARRYRAARAHASPPQINIHIEHLPH